MHISSSWIAWFSVFWATFHDFVYLGAYLLLDRVGFWRWWQRVFRIHPKPLTKAQLHKQLNDLHQRIHTLEKRLENTLGDQ